MKKILVIMLIAMAVILVAQTKSADTKASATKIENTVCPVMGGEVNPAVKTVAYKGKNYGFCCNGCPEAFKKDPEKYLKEVKKTDTAIKVENTVCPVMGGEVNPAVKTVAYKGKNYGFCCGGCPETFKKDPEKYLKNLKKDAKTK